MGYYNWQLFVLCGFGWFADKYVSWLFAFTIISANLLTVSGSKVYP